MFFSALKKGALLNIPYAHSPGRDVVVRVFERKVVGTIRVSWSMCAQAVTTGLT